MNYALYPTPVWITTNRWKKVASWRKNAIIRDKYRCVDCHNGSNRLIVHHIDETGTDEIQNNSLSNLVTLCSKCHAKRHGLNGSIKNKNVVKMLEEYSDENKNLINGAATIISKRVGLTRERVRQLANGAGFITYNNKKNVFLYSRCFYCGKKFRKNRSNRQTCSPSCSRNYLFYRYWTIVECKQCHLYFIVRISKLKSRGRYFCGKTCQGKWLADNYGFSVTNNNYRPLKYDINNLSKDFPDPFTKQDFARKYGYASGTTAYVALSNLMFKGVVGRYNENVRNLFVVKQKPVIDKSR
jgi:hypothetical protein